MVSEPPPPPTPPQGEKPAKGPAQKKPKKPTDWGKVNACRDQYALIYGTDTVFDRLHRRVVRVNTIRLAHGNDIISTWLESKKRETILPEQLVFEPNGKIPPGCINLFDGMPTEPKAGDCKPIIELLTHLCSEVVLVDEGKVQTPDDDAPSRTPEGVMEVVDWILKWLAYPLQHPGAKMQSALLVHGPQGAGKNLFFDIVRNIYGKYGTTVGQDQLESQFNDWASQKLFVIGDEISSRQELWHVKNKLKSLVTGDTLQINTKMLPLRAEANHINFVFLSNDPKAMALEDGDRRYMTVWTPTMRHDGLYTRVHECLQAGGMEAFCDYLMRYDISGFSPHSRPPLTQAKQDLVDLCRTPEERFAYQWLTDFLPIRVTPCSNDQLYRVFRRWCFKEGEKATNKDRFGRGLKAILQILAGRQRQRPRLEQRVCKAHGNKACRLWMVPGTGPSNDDWRTWASSCIDDFEREIAGYMGDEREFE